MKIKPIVLASLAFFSVWNLSTAEISQVKLPKIDASIGQYAYLRDKLPADTMAYIRVAHPVTHFFSPKNRTNDAALLHKNSIQAFKEFREVLGDNEKLTKRIQLLGLNFNGENLEIINTVSALLYQYLNGPVEGFISNHQREFSLTAQGLISIPVNIRSIEDLNTILAENPLKTALIQFDKNGYATHEMASFYFSPKEQRIVGMVGIEPYSLEQIKQRLENLKPERHHEMYAFENQIDLTGQSNFFWVDLRNKTGIFTAAMEDQKAWPIVKEIDGIAFGEGSNNEQQGQLKFIVKANTEKALGLDFKSKNDFSFKTVGMPKGAVILPIPSVSIVKKAIETYLFNEIPTYLVDETTNAEVLLKTEELYKEFQAESVKYIGFDLDEVLGFLGNNITFYYDDLGIHSVLSMQDKKHFYKWLEQKDQEGVLTYTKDRKIHHLKLQNPLLKLLQKEDLSKPEHAGLALAYPFVTEYVANIYGVRALDLNLHLYWSDEGDYIRISSLPQIVEEENNKGNERFDHWLTDRQGVDARHVMFAATLDWKNADRDWYYNYLQFLQNSADILGTNFDVTKMPQADQLPFAESSRLGVQITGNNHFLTFSLDYGSDHNAGFISSLFFPSFIAPFAGLLESISDKDYY